MSFVNRISFKSLAYSFPGYAGQQSETHAGG